MRQKASKILIIIFLLVFILQLAGIVFLLLVPQEIQAADVKFKPQVGVGEFKTVEQGGPKEGYAVSGNTSMIGNYIVAIYKYAIGIVGILAAVVMMWGGVIWLTAGGNAERIGDAKSWIAASLSGLVLALASYMILATINPSLVKFEVKSLTTIGSAKNCCSKIRGAFPGFAKTVDNKKEFSCSPVPDDKKADYGDVAEYDSTKQTCKKQGDNTYGVKNLDGVKSSGCCACTSANCSSSILAKCLAVTTKAECDAISISMGNAFQSTWTFYQQSCDKYPTLCK